MKWHLRGLSRKIILIAGVVAIVAIIAANVLAIGLRNHIKRGIETILHDRFESDVEIQNLQVSVFPRIHALAQGIVLRHKGRTDVPPLIAIEKLTLTANITGLLRSPKHIASVHLDGLQIHIPPRDQGAPRARVEPARKITMPVVIDELTSDDALLETLPNEKGKLPRDFAIHRLTMISFGFDRPAPFHATLTNPMPIGEIDSEGQFGPWQPDEPGDTPTAATFRYSSADLGSLNTLSGILSSTGKYSGVLDHLDVEGDTDTPDFALKAVGNPVPLATHYVAVVDGTNGNTYLTLVEARLQNSAFTTSGEITGIPGVKGRHVTLVADSQDARLEDFLRLAAKGSEPPMRGAIGLHVKIDIPAGEGPIINRLSLKGHFGVAGAKITAPGVQDKIDSLSRGAQGQPKNQEIQDVISNVRGQFVLRKGTVTFSNLTFGVPGATVRLKGSYNLHTDELDFHGHLLIEVKLSKTVTGARSVFLKFVDSFFKKNGGGSSVPIKITGTRTNPSFGLDLHKSDARK
jgi:hypothetical protein